MPHSPPFGTGIDIDWPEGMPYQVMITDHNWFKEYDYKCERCGRKTINEVLYDMPYARKIVCYLCFLNWWGERVP